MSAPAGTPISQVDWSEISARRLHVAGWVYPRRNISWAVPLLPRPQQLAISLWVLVSLALFVSAIVLAFIKGPIWLLLIVAAVVTWKANRKSMEQFFVQNLGSNQAFYEQIKSHIGDQVSIVWKD